MTSLNLQAHNVYLDPTTHVAPREVGKSIYDQMMEDLRGKHRALVDELTEFRRQRFPERTLDDTQAFDPIAAEIVYPVQSAEATTVDEITVMTSREVRRRARQTKGLLRKVKRQNRKDSLKAKVKNYLYEHWGIKFEEPPNK